MIVTGFPQTWKVGQNREICAMERLGKSRKYQKSWKSQNFVVICFQNMVMDNISDYILNAN